MEDWWREASGNRVLIYANGSISKRTTPVSVMERRKVNEGVHDHHHHNDEPTGAIRMDTHKHTHSLKLDGRTRTKWARATNLITPGH